ncbi:MAG: nicotinate (nicotinamide) nucleotide adenylyltransferase [Acidimicrobiia bacterium]
MLWRVQGILGGTFDPPHIAHLAMARAAHAQLGLEIVRLMPAGDPWQKRDTAVTDATHRWAMTVLVAQEEEWLVADDVEIKRHGPSYTIDTITQMKQRCVLILGADTALGIPTWHRRGELVDSVDIAVAPRPGISIDSVELALGRGVFVLDMDPIELSSTRIRELAAAGGEFSHLLTRAVWRYIGEHELYGTA